MTKNYFLLSKHGVLYLFGERPSKLIKRENIIQISKEQENKKMPADYDLKNTLSFNFYNQFKQNHN